MQRGQLQAKSKPTAAIVLSTLPSPIPSNTQILSELLSLIHPSLVKLGTMTLNPREIKVVLEL